MTRSLLDRWCPEPHEAPLLAVAHDLSSGTTATADADGLVVSTRTHGADLEPLRHGAPVRALAVAPGGALVAVGDDDGSFVVYRASDGREVYADRRGGDEGRARGVRAAVFAASSREVAYLSADGVVRLIDLTTGDTRLELPHCSGAVLDWDPTGSLLVVADRLSQPVLVDLSTHERDGFSLIPGGVLQAAFLPDGQRVLLLGEASLHVVDLDSRQILASRNAGRSSRLVAFALAPDGQRAAVLTSRSVHFFHVDRLNHVGKESHGTPAPTGALLFDRRGVAVACEDGRLYRPDAPAPPLPPTVCVAGAGGWRAAGHEHTLALWRDGQRLRTFVPHVTVLDPTGGDAPTQRPMVPRECVLEVSLDGRGKVLAALPDGGPVHVYDARSGRLLFQAGSDTIDTPRLEVAYGVVACLLPQGGIRWFDLRNNRTHELDWVLDFAITGGGNWLAAITPQGRVRILDVRTGKALLDDLDSPTDSAARLLAFVHRKPALLVLDDDDVLTWYDLTAAIKDGDPVETARITAFEHCEIDAIWGLEDDRHAVVRIHDAEAQAAVFVTLDLDTGEVVHEVEGLLEYATVDASRGAILEPARGNAILERSLDGRERDVLRSLPDDAWVAFGPQGRLHESPHAAKLLGREGSAPRAGRRAPRR